MLQSRRKFCQQMLAIGATLSASTLMTGCFYSGSKVFANAFTLPSGEHYVGWFNGTGQLLGKVRVPQRAHDLKFISGKHVLLAFARRPGNYFYVIDINLEKVIQSVKTADGQHLYGHGAISRDGNWLYTTENRFAGSLEPKEGVISVRNTRNWSVEATYLSGGVGPHQLLSLSDPNLLVIANGGIHTHPSLPRTKLNTETMKPNISYLDVNKGTINDSVTPPHHQLSMRHLCVDQRDNVYIGCQFQGPEYQINPLIFKHYIKGSLQPFYAENSSWSEFAQYTASLAISDDNKMLAVTSPKGGIVSYWDTNSLKLIETLKLKDCAAIAPSGNEFIVSTGRGEIAIKNNAMVRNSEIKWDNHMAV
ncbi:hypothetical protein N480_03175 [Pseudoalteromonas luteoviolacea S2607]|uniref:DUF1513 domain-containing protein n=1 Tax=Pseudoalteromonas luteoviolacea TaxID=43657 RepID=UPI0007B03EAE|nr:DUF1513 domain-containing protein [Pseudoalteromonas luteoviolacea]KZN30973.1 hypothetical protein N480_03175 [Pseudoalteromonas luteoviolacea S2607]